MNTRIKNQPMKTPIENLFLLPALIAGLGLIPAGRLTAQNFTTLHSFTGSDGANPYSSLIFSNNTLYGTAGSSASPSNGTVFAMNTNGMGFTILHSFPKPSGPYPPTNSDGAYPFPELILSGNTLYGTTYGGGSSGYGTVFAVNTNGTNFATLYSFTGGSDGGFPEAGLILSGNTLFGESDQGGTSGLGTVFALNTNGTGFTNLYNFTGGSDGAEPLGGLILSDNRLYGVARDGGSSFNGTVFALTTDGTEFTILHSFIATSDGHDAQARLIISGNTLYGTATLGGSANRGTVFALNTDGTQFRTLHSFTAGFGAYPNYTNSDGAYPADELILSGNTLYGTAGYGGSSANGTVFALNIDGSAFTTLHSFTALNNRTNSDGANPSAGLILSGNTLYGATFYGGSSGYGTIFSLSLPPPQLTIIPSGTNIILTWPTNATGFTLQSTTNLVSPVFWTNVSPGPVVVDWQNAVTNPISGTRQFYRLRQ